jgi:flagellar basal body-associated protein FliL
MPEAEKKNLSEPSARRRNRFALGFSVVALVAVSSWFWIHREAEPAEAASETRIKATLHLEAFVLNLSDANERAYLRIGIDLGLNREMKRGEEAPVAEVRDTILGVLAQGKVDDLLTAAGKTKLKENLLAALQQRIPRLGVEEVYFTEFLIQR